eukprot:CAMPEP_0119273962 /NCGR_PEP_ID=MMETSP1329-20130426/11226_1 /TAXON_ID=114041 /ORGANISM="Genus nov. species nov., Strain RCC1024" /LENGTH=369 /DNA_ID=CAMNT_0007274229 /DNA_START=170 /DNA_END=1275 /DNA_ORIENTATION=-
MAEQPSFGWQTELTATAPIADDTRSDLEKQSAVVDLLRGRVGSAPLTAALIAASRASVDLAKDKNVDDMIRNNPRVRVTFDDEMEALYEYAAEHDDVHDLASLKAFIERRPDGIRAEEVHDCYVGAARDTELLITSGGAVAIFDASSRKTCLFPRPPAYLVQLQGEAEAVDARTLATTRDVQDEVRRGDAVALCMPNDRRWVRVASLVRTHAASNQPNRAKRPLSVSSVRPMHSANQYADAFDATTLPCHGEDPLLDSEGAPPRGSWPLAKHGCTNDVRELWLKTAAETPVDHAQLERKMIDEKLDSNRKKERPRRKRAARVEDETKKRRRLAPMFHRLTNTHLKGTEIGAILEEAMRHDYRDRPEGEG